MVVVEHRLDPKEAIRRIKEAYMGKKAKYASIATVQTEEWEDLAGAVTASVLGTTITGTVQCQEETVTAVCELPLPLKVIFGRDLHEKIENRLTSLLSK